MDNVEGNWADTCEMMLLYPIMDAHLSADYVHKGHKTSIRTINLNQPWQGNLPASCHNGAANMAWADGHLELHRWGSNTVRPPVQGGAGGGFVPSPATDYLWLRDRTSIKLN